MFNLVVHKHSLDYTELWDELQEQITHIKGGDQPGQCSFTHMVGDYDLSYVYSLVFAADMYATVFKKAPLDPELGKLYCDKILLPGATRDEMDLLQDFLGRKPNPRAFIEQTEK